MSRPRLNSESRKKHLAAAKRWCARQKAARRQRGDRDAMRCHEQAMRHLYLMLGHVPLHPGPGELL